LSEAALGVAAFYGNAIQQQAVIRDS